MSTNAYNYYNTIAQNSPRLPLFEELALIRTVSSGETLRVRVDAIEKLFRHNVFVALVAARKTVHRRADMLDDAVATAVEALLQAAHTVKDQGCPFECYARPVVLHALANWFGASHLVPLSKYAVRVGRGQEAGREHRQDLEVAVRNSCHEPVSLDAALDRPEMSNAGESESSDLYDVLVSPADDPSECAERAIDLDTLLGHLTAKERTVISFRYGIDGKDIVTLSRIAELLDCSAEYVRLIEREALRKLAVVARQDMDAVTELLR